MAFGRMSQERQDMEQDLAPLGPGVGSRGAPAPNMKNEARDDAMQLASLVSNAPAFTAALAPASATGAAAGGISSAVAGMGGLGAALAPALPVLGPLALMGGAMSLFNKGDDNVGNEDDEISMIRNMYAATRQYKGGTHKVAGIDPQKYSDGTGSVRNLDPITQYILDNQPSDNPKTKKLMALLEEMDRKNQASKMPSTEVRNNPFQRSVNAGQEAMKDMKAREIRGMLQNLQKAPVSSQVSNIGKLGKTLFKGGPLGAAISTAMTPTMAADATWSDEQWNTMMKPPLSDRAMKQELHDQKLRQNEESHRVKMSSVQ